MLINFGFAIDALASDPTKIVGPNACAECHKREARAWKASHHFKTFREMPRKPEANKIGTKMGVRRIKLGAICVDCHFTVQEQGGKEKVVSGISCESCHGAGKDWLKTHSEFSGKTKLFESKAEAKARWELSVSQGLIRVSAFYKLAKNCYGCHLVPTEDLVNKGGHPAGSAFELVSWSQGEVRHNTWYSFGKDNVAANAEHKRMLYLVGLGAELEAALRAIGKATTRRTFAFAMAKRADRVRKELAAAAEAVPGVPEIAEIVKLSHSAGLRLNNSDRLTAAADGISQQLTLITDKYDGSTMAGLDSMIPGPDKYKGTASKPDE